MGPDVIRYQTPGDWITYDRLAVVEALVEARAAVLSLKTIPYQRSWVDSLQLLQLKREVAGTSRIEGAEFTERELDAALGDSPEQLVTRSQRQAHAAVQTYRWIAGLPDDMPVDEALIKAIHFRIVKGADDDHCVPGKPRGANENVLFGTPRHRGVEGGDVCAEVLTQYARALQREYKSHDPLIQALAAHYHLAAMHPFLDGNGRTARAIEALLLQRAGLRDACFIAMSNYYYDEKSAYRKALNEVRAKDQDLTPFLVFGLRGIALQSRRLLAEIQHENAKALFRNLMYDLFGRLKSPRRRVIAARQIEMLKVLLESGWINAGTFSGKVSHLYKSLKNPEKAILRDIRELAQLGALNGRKTTKGETEIAARLEWPMEITETEFFDRVKKLPKTRSFSFF